MNAASISLTNSPWRLADMNSYYLFGLGLIAAISAFYKGCTFDDPYPFYGAKSRAVENAREAYSDDHAELFDALAEIKDNTIQKLSDGIVRIPLFPQQAANIRAQRAALVQTFRGYEASVVTSANQLLSRYRDRNRRTRQTPVPNYFDRSWHLPHSFLDSVEVRTLTADGIERDADVNATLVELRRTLTGGSRRISEITDRIPSSDPNGSRQRRAVSTSVKTLGIRLLVSPYL